MKKVTFIIANYNTGLLLIDCVKNLLSISDVFEIIVVDNGSQDSSVSELKKDFPP